MKKLIFVAMCLVMACSMLAVLTSCDDSSIQEGVADEIIWSDLVLGQYIPEIKNVHGDIGSNLNHALSITIYNTNKEQFDAYKDECISVGYTIESVDDEKSYDAFNSDGYKLRIVYYDDGDFHIQLDAPEEMADFEWPSIGLGVLLPATKSTFGDISWDNSETFIVHVGNTPLNEYNEYVKLCQEKGFTVDYSKSDNYYSAKNSYGYELTVRYLGYNTIEVCIRTTEETISLHDTTIQTDPPVTDAPSADGLSEDFKTAMDSYEAFFDEYVDFMKKYKESNGTDLSLLLDYSNYVSKYAEMLADFEKWENCELSNEELAYYMQVQNRITQKLLEVAE